MPGTFGTQLFISEVSTPTPQTLCKVIHVLPDAGCSIASQPISPVSATRFQSSSRCSQCSLISLPYLPDLL
jgi:hypothetical protein